MMAVLPGIDANDEQKTLVAFRFFCIVLSSVGELSVRACGRGGRARRAPAAAAVRPVESQGTDEVGAALVR
jgi:hypothetical protein